MFSPVTTPFHILSAFILILLITPSFLLMQDLLGSSDAKFHDIYIEKHLRFGSKNLLRRGEELDGKDKYNNKIPLYISVIKYTDSNHEIRFIGIIRKLKSRLYSEISNFQSIYLVSHEYRFECNFKGKILDYNSFLVFLGYNEFNRDLNFLYYFTHKNDLEKLKIIFKKIQELREINNEIIRIVKKNQKEIYFSWNSNLIPV